MSSLVKTSMKSSVTASATVIGHGRATTENTTHAMRRTLSPNAPVRMVRHTELVSNRYGNAIIADTPPRLTDPSAARAALMLSLFLSITQLIGKWLPDLED